MIIRSNGSVELVGKTVVVDHEFEGYLFAGYLIRLRIDPTIGNPDYLQMFLSSPSVRSYIELTARSTSGVNNISSEELRSIQVDLPPLEEQHEIVRRVETIFGYADRLEARYGAGGAVDAGVVGEGVSGGTGGAGSGGRTGGGVVGAGAGGAGVTVVVV